MSRDDGKPATILLVEEDDDTRPLLRTGLQRDGYNVLIAVDEEDALDRVAHEGARADLLLVNLVGKAPTEALEAGRRIRLYGKYDGMTPLVILAEKYGKDLEGQDVNVANNEWITYIEDAEQLHHLIARLLGELEK